jgi:hypothetical protein
VSPRSKGKDYGEAFRKYEKDLKVPYCLMYYPAKRDLRLHRHDGKRYRLLEEDESGRRSLPELELEIGMLAGWVRFWHRGELLPLPADLQAENEALKKRLRKDRRTAAAERKRAEQEKEKRLALEEELARLKAAVQKSQGNGAPKNGAAQ